VSPIESNAPALMSDSTVRLFATCIGTVSRKWWKLVKPSSPRLDDAVDDVRPDVADGAEPEADVFADGREVADRLADIGRSTGCPSAGTR
jgi:hypothetical protein